MSLDKAAANLKSDLSEVESRSGQFLEKLVEKQQSTTERVVRVETKIEMLTAIAPPNRM